MAGDNDDDFLNEIGKAPPAEKPAGTRRVGLLVTNETFDPDAWQREYLNPTTLDGQFHHVDLWPVFPALMGNGDPDCPYIALPHTFKDGTVVQQTIREGLAALKEKFGVDLTIAEFLELSDIKPEDNQS